MLTPATAPATGLIEPLNYDKDYFSVATRVDSTGYDDPHGLNPDLSANALLARQPRGIGKSSRSIRSDLLRVL